MLVLTKINQFDIFHKSVKLIVILVLMISILTF